MRETHCHLILWSLVAIIQTRQGGIHRQAIARPLNCFDGVFYEVAADVEALRVRRQPANEGPLGYGVRENIGPSGGVHG